MKLLAIVAMSIVIPCGATLAQEATPAPAPAATPDVQLPTAEELAGRWTQRMTGSLSLTEEQVPQVEAIVTESMRGLLERFEASGRRTDPRTLQQLGGSLRQEQEALREALAPVLTPEQREQLDAELEQQRQDVAAEAWLARYRQPLALTVKQEETLRPIAGQHMIATFDLLEQRSSSRTGGRAQPRAMMAARGEMQQLESELEKELAGVLTEQQLEAYRRLRAEARQRMRQRFAGRGRPGAGGRRTDR